MGRGDNASLPPLAQDVYDRLAILELDIEAARLQRAFMNIESRPELLSLRAQLPPYIFTSGVGSSW